MMAITTNSSTKVKPGIFRDFILFLVVAPGIRVPTQAVVGMINLPAQRNSDCNMNGRRCNGFLPFKKSRICLPE